MPHNRRANLTRRHAGPHTSAEGRPHRTMNVGLLAGFLLVVTAVPIEAQTLTDALAEAYNTNPQLLAQRALLRATDEQVPQALSFWRPQVTFTGQVGITTSSLETRPGPEARVAGLPISVDHAITRPDSLTFQLIQPVYRGGRTEAQTRQAINTVESTR